MKKSRMPVAVVFVLALLASATSAFGLPAMKADIPFDFVVSSEVLPAGNYDILFRRYPIGIQTINALTG